MYIKSFFNDLNLTKKDGIYLLALTVFSILLSVHLIDVNYSLNFKSDPFVYLINGLVYAGMQGHIENYSYGMFLTPVVSFLTSLLFRLGIVDKIAIMIVSDSISILGQIGLYLLFRTKFKEVYSFFGCILFASFHIILTIWGGGGIDIPVCAFSIITFLFMVLAVDKNPKYYIPTSIFLIISIFTKYDALFIIPILFLYYLAKHDFFNLLDLAISDRDELKTVIKNYIKSEEFKYIVISLVIAVVLFILFCEVIWSYGANLTFLTQSQESLNGFNSAKAARSHFYYNDKKYYITNLYTFFYPQISYWFSLIIPAIIAIGTVFNFANIIRRRKEYPMVRDYKTSHFKYLLVGLIIILIPIALIGFKYISHMVTNVAILTICVCLLSLADKFDIDKRTFNLDIFFLAWIFVFAVFFSFITIKGQRYLIIALPAVVYFVLRTIEEILKKFKDSNILKIALIIIAAIIIVYSLTFTFTDGNFDTERNNTAIQEVYDYLVEYDPDYLNKNLSSDYSYGSRFGTWTLKKDVRYVKLGVIDQSQSDYLIVKHDNASLTNYTEIYRVGMIRLYQNKMYDNSSI